MSPVKDVPTIAAARETPAAEKGQEEGAGGASFSAMTSSAAATREEPVSMTPALNEESVEPVATTVGEEKFAAKGDRTEGLPRRVDSVDDEAMVLLPVEPPATSGVEVAVAPEAAEESLTDEEVTASDVVITSGGPLVLPQEKEKQKGVVASMEGQGHHGDATQHDNTAEPDTACLSAVVHSSEKTDVAELGGTSPPPVPTVVDTEADQLTPVEDGAKSTAPAVVTAMPNMPAVEGDTSGDLPPGDMSVTVPDVINVGSGDAALTAAPAAGGVEALGSIGSAAGLSGDKWDVEVCLEPVVCRGWSAVSIWHSFADMYGSKCSWAVPIIFSRSCRRFESRTVFPVRAD